MRRLRPARRAVGTAVGVPLAAVPLFLAAIVGTAVPWQRILRDLPRAAGADYAFRFDAEFAPLREGYVQQVLGGRPMSGSVDRFTARSGPTPRSSVREPLHDLPTGGTRRVTPTHNDPSEIVWVSDSPSMSVDGSRVAFRSADPRIVGAADCLRSPPRATAAAVFSKLTPQGRFDDTAGAGCPQILVMDLRSGETTIASLGHSGAPANDGVESYMLSGDGRFVVFTTAASNIVPHDLNDVTDVFVRDLVNQRTELISVSVHGGAIRRPPQDLGGYGRRDLPDPTGARGPESGTISHDGRYVAFESFADDIVPQEEPGTIDVFVRDRWAGTTERVSVSSRGVPAEDDPDGSKLERQALPCMSPSGRYVAFSSVAKNLASSDLNNHADVFLHDRVTNATELVSVTPTGVSANSESQPAAGTSKIGNMNAALKNCISNDGRFVLFQSWATNLTEKDRDIVGSPDVFLRDRRQSTTIRVSAVRDGDEPMRWWMEEPLAVPAYNNSDGGALSPDGKFVFFESNVRLTRDDPDPPPTYGPLGAEGYDLFVFEIATGRLSRLDVREQAGAGASVLGAAPSRGGLVAFHTKSRLDLAGVHIHRWRNT